MKKTLKTSTLQLKFMRGIRFKITFGIIVILGAILLLVGHITINEQHSRMMAEMRAYGQETASFIARISVVPIEKFSIYQLENYVAQLEKGELISYCEIHDTEGNALAHSTKTPDPTAKPAGLTADTLIFNADITSDTALLGNVELGINLQPVQAQIHTMTTYITIAFWIELFLIGTCVSFFIYKSLVAPILRLSRTTEEIAAGRFTSSRLAARHDEIGLLAKTINSMSTRLEEYYQNLEAKVAARTAELESAKNHSETTARNLEVVSSELEALLDNSPVAILFVTPDRIIQRVNREFSTIFGYSANEAIGQSTRILYHSDADFENATKTTYSVLKSMGFCQATIEMRKKDGTTITCSMRGRKTLLDNNFEGITWSIENISSKLRMEEELLNARKLESISILAGGIAHDFNNILVAIIGNISLAERLVADNAKAVELLHNSKQASLRAKDLTIKLLTFSKGGEPVKSLENLPEIVKESASFVLSGSNVKCNYDIADNLWAVPMDKGQINQVIQNLVLNANQSMPDGGTITITCRNITLVENDIAELPPGKFVQMAISDMGAGIDSRLIDNIFDPYFTTKGKSSEKGSGLGLSIVHSIIKKHGGAILVDSTLGEGTVFTLFFPATERSVAENDSPHAPILPQGKGVILLMDDEQDIHDVTEEMLTFLGYTTLHADSGEEAIALYRDYFETGNSIDAVIMDLTIPGGMGGGEAVGKILEIDPEARVIVSSGYSDDPLLQNYTKAGFANCITKPYQLLELSKILADTLQR